MQMMLQAGTYDHTLSNSQFPKVARVVTGPEYFFSYTHYIRECDGIDGREREKGINDMRSHPRKGLRKGFF